MGRRNLSIEVLLGTFAVARLDPASPVPRWAHSGPFCSVTRTPTEVSIVCDDGSVPPAVHAQRGLRCLRVVGPLDFSETGILEALAGPLAQVGISIFVLSTYDTDYVLVSADQLSRAAATLANAGHTVREVMP